ncbi:ankyrin, partial [Colletotrichum somersetense]
MFGTDEILDLASTINEALDVNQRRKLGYTPVYLAAAFRRLSTGELLVKHGANINTVGGKFGSPLHAASYSGYSKVVESLLQLSADVNCGMELESSGLFGTPLRTASLLNFHSIVRLLLDKGAKVDFCGPYGDALQAAATNGHISAVRLLLQEGANVNQQAGFYGSALQAAA